MDLGARWHRRLACVSLHSNSPGNLHYGNTGILPVLHRLEACAPEKGLGEWVWERGQGSATR